MILFHISKAPALVLLVCCSLCTKALGLNCSSESMLLYNNSDYLEANNKFLMSLGEKCNSGSNNYKPNDVCISSNSSNATSFHLLLSINLATAKNDEESKSFAKACQNAGGKVVYPNMQIGFKDFNLTAWLLTWYTKADIPIIDPSVSQFIDFTSEGIPECVVLPACENLTDVGEFIKDEWEMLFGLNVYNFSIYNMSWD